MEFFKAFAFMVGMGVVLGIGVLIMAQGSGFLSIVPFFGGFGVFVWLFTRYGCLHMDYDGDHH